MGQNTEVISGSALHEKLKSLTKVGGNRNWEVFYVDPESNKWVLSYPNAHYHGGGAPELRKVARFPENPNDY